MAGDMPAITMFIDSHSGMNDAFSALRGTSRRACPS